MEIKQKLTKPKGKLGILTPGMGAVATTFYAGVEAVRRGHAKPFGSLTQMGTIRLGKRTENRTPLIKDFVPLAGLDDLVFGGWDIFEDNAYEAAMHAGVLEPRAPREGAPVPREREADEGGLRPELREAPLRHVGEEGRRTGTTSPSSSRRTSSPSRSARSATGSSWSGARAPRSS